MNEIMVPRMKPAAPWSWELRDVLARTAPESQRMALDLPGPSLIVGVHVTVRQASFVGGGLILPTPDDVLVLLDIDSQQRYTNAQPQSSSASQGQQFVVSSSLDTQFRDLNIRATSPRPVIGATWRWRTFDPTTPRYEDASVSIAFFVCELGNS